MMKEVARYAERYDVVVGLEDWISAEDNIKLLDAIGSDYVAVYYDAHNIVDSREGHLRRAEDARHAHPPDSREERQHAAVRARAGKLDWPRMAQEFYEIGYRGWYVLETGSPSKDIVADTRANIEFVKKTFRMPAA